MILSVSAVQKHTLELKVRLLRDKAASIFFTAEPWLEDCLGIIQFERAFISSVKREIKLIAWVNGMHRKNPYEYICYFYLFNQAKSWSSSEW